MKYVLDTNVIKRFGGENPNANIKKWHRTINDNDIYITALSILEMNKGIASKRKKGDAGSIKLANSLSAGLNQLILDFKDRILPLDEVSGMEWGRRLAKHGTKDASDLGIISITASNQPATVVTQNLQDFRHRGIKVLNPYDDPPSKFNDPET
jgi:predicted nucleic acid-binding protein